MTVTVEPPTLEGLRHICANLRKPDADEIFALRWDDDPEALALRYAALPPSMVDMLSLDGEPVAIVGAVPLWPGVWEAFAFGTDKWHKVIITLTKRARRFIIPALLNSGAHRLQCWSAEGHTTAHAWLSKSLGARRGPKVSGFGRDGSAYFLFEILRQPGDSEASGQCAAAAPQK